MQHLTKTELRRLFEVAHARNPYHHLAMVIGFTFALRVTELISIKGSDIQDGLLSVQRLKGSERTVQPIRYDSDPLFDSSPVLALAAANPGRLFKFTRQRVNQFLRRYAKLAGIHTDKAHSHSIFKHSLAMCLWDKTHDLGQIQGYLGHKSPSSTMAYLRENDRTLAFAAVAGLSL